MFPKWLKPRMEWFLYGSIALMIAGAVYYFVLPSRAPIDEVNKFYTRAPLHQLQEVITEHPEKIQQLRFLSERNGKVVDAFPHTVQLDVKPGDEKVGASGTETKNEDKSLWSELAGNEEYVRLSKLATDNHVYIDSRIVDAPPETPFLVQVMMSFGPFLLLLVVGSYLLNKHGGLPNQASKNGKVNLVRLDQMGSPVKLSDVQGIDDERKTLEELIRNLKNPTLLVKLGGEIPRGVLLKGPPGVGKTYIIQAIAGETKIPILSGAGSDFVEQYVGVGAARIRDAFAQARKLRDETGSWVILFIDEFTTVGQNRAANAGGGSTEHGQTVDALLVELNGAANDNSRILFVAATNQPEGLDEAITRSGRLGDLQIEISKPDKEGRLAILKKKLEKIPHLLSAEDVEKIASEMTGMTGADIETLIRKRTPARAARRLIGTLPAEKLLDPAGLDYDKTFAPQDIASTMDDVWHELMDMTLGNISETKGRRLDPAVKEMIAKHETGHLTLAIRKLLQNTGRWDGQYGDKITDVSILGPNGIGGFVRTVPEHGFQTAKYLKSRLAVALAGNVSERLFTGDTTGGCQNDLEQANRIIKAMLLQINMSDRHNLVDKDGKPLKKLPAISVQEQGGGSRYLRGVSGGHAPQYGMSDGSAWQVDELITIYLDEAYEEAEAYLREEAEWVDYFWQILVERERMRWNEIEEHWSKFHKNADLSKSFAYVYQWDPNQNPALANGLVQDTAAKVVGA